MSSFRFHVALAAAKLSKGLIQLLGRNGTHTPGVIALKICPDFLAQAPKAYVSQEQMVRPPVVT